MKSTVFSPKEVNAYPCFKRPQGRTSYTDYVVLFTMPSRGTVVYAHPDAVNSLGEFSSNWDERVFDTLPAGSKITIEA